MQSLTQSLDHLLFAIIACRFLRPSQVPDPSVNPCRIIINHSVARNTTLTTSCPGTRGPAAPPNSKREPHDTVELSYNDIDQEIGLFSCELAPPRLNNYQLKSYCVFTPLLPALPYHTHETALSRLILGLPFFSASPVASFCLHTDVTDGHV